MYLWYWGASDVHARSVASSCIWIPFAVLARRPHALATWARYSGTPGTLGAVYCFWYPGYVGSRAPAMYHDMSKSPAGVLYCA
eukprot:6185931-Pleurochrysis_carterae.AAC.1